jgi:hypothetical protein
MKQIKFRSRTERVLRTACIVMYAFRSNTELVPVFQSTGTLVPFGILAESGRNVPPSVLGDALGIVPPDLHGLRNGSRSRRCMFFVRRFYVLHNHS